MRERPYNFLDLTNSLCSRCLRKVEAKIIAEGQRVYLLKHCPSHGAEKVLISTDLAYYQRARAFVKPGQLPLRTNTETLRGCPFDCGLCPDHEQHSCLALIEITDQCNLECPICYASSSPARARHRSLDEIERMLDTIVANEGRPDIVQISGGEPTIHPRFFDVLEAARRRPIKHLMLNTNGVRIAQSEEFVRRLAEQKQGFEVYLQFDSLEADALLRLRAEDLRDVRRRALERLDRHGIATTLVVTVQKGLNDGELGRILEHATTIGCVRGVTFQPVQVAGRTQGFDPARDRLTLSEVRQKLVEQSDLFSADDIVPVPCHPDCIAMAYGLRVDGRIVPLTRFVPDELLKTLDTNNLLYEQIPELRDRVLALFSAAHSPESSATTLGELLCCLPAVPATPALRYDQVFRVILMQFLDAYSFDVRSVKRSCVHIVHPDGRVIPFDTFNLFHREAPGELVPLSRAPAAPRGH